MSNMYLLNEIITNGSNVFFLSIIYWISIFCGVMIIVTKNPIVSVLFLIGLFFSIAGYLMMLGINFIGLSYLLVYVGAVSILFLFILMLINVRVSELITENNNGIPLAVLIITLAGLSQLSIKTMSMPIRIANNIENTQGITMYSNMSSYNDILVGISSSWDEKLAETFHITTIGNIIYTNYPMWLILTSIILLLAMVGSILITIKQ